MDCRSQSQTCSLYCRNNDPNNTATTKWTPQQNTNPVPNDIISTAATSPGAIIQSTVSTPQHPGLFKVLVEENGNVAHYFRDNSIVGNGWTRKPKNTITNAMGPASFIQSTAGTPNSTGRFEAVVRHDSPTDLWHCSQPSDDSTDWIRNQRITTNATGAGCIIQSNYRTPNSPGNFEVVVQEGSNLVHYYFDKSNTSATWTTAP